ncbi:T9SS type A sorting domain-containing protein [Hymenobacter weizhouensis]|uniref:T9SS type A sorting domain-containing protein n=1 Tax=Hymenobacter sp. YIM 151500-1 TaxID=2987689 RepID=UPI002227B0C0|nr:T9SS type A sorting domain-containing protein [Hymenobacter sp. YIM 151500-1]UYZ62264.1 T9SS type A sorting domain-containing protein [Hymenobacter sp. YIM 151500-1]
MEHSDTFPSFSDNSNSFSNLDSVSRRAFLRTMGLATGGVWLASSGLGTFAGLAGTAGTATGADYDFGFGQRDKLRVPFSYKAVTAVAAGDILMTAQGAGPGDLPAGWRWKALTGANAPIPLQQDLENTHDGSTRTAALAWAAPAALAAGQETTIYFSAERLAPNRTPHTTAQQIAAATDFYLEASGGDFASASLRVSFNHILATYPEQNPATGWGTNPVGGWRYTKRGSLVVGVHAWAYFRNPSGGATHAYLRGDLFVYKRSTGQYEVGAITQQPNAYGPHPAGTIGNRLDQQGIACHMTLKNGAQVLHRWGGPQDPLAFDVPATAFAGERLHLPAGELETQDYGHGVPLMVAGNSLPAGLTAGTIYYGYTFNVPALRLTTERLNADTTVSFSGGSGTVRVYPVHMTWPNTKAMLLTEAGRRIWVGAGTQPVILPAHDQLYLSRRAQLIPHYDLSYAVPLSGERKFLHVASAASYFSADWRAGSDAENVDRIGPIPYRHARLLRCPFDEALDQNTRVQALNHAGHIYNILDERSGQPPVHTRGADGNGAPFPGMGPNNFGFRSYGGGRGQVGNPQFGGNDAARWLATRGPRQAGIGRQYDMNYDGAHATQFNLVPYLRTGDELYLELALCMALTLAASEYADYLIGTRRVSGVNRQGNRHGAWAISIMDDADCILPDAYPARGLLSQVLNDTAFAYQHEALNGPTRHLGIIWGKGRPWHNSMHTRMIAKMVLRNRRPEWRTAAECAARITVDFYDDQGPVPNAGAMVNDISLEDRDANGVIFPSLAAMFTSPINYGPGPFAATGFGPAPGTGKVVGRSEYARMALAAQSDLLTCHNWGLATIPNAARVRQQTYNRITTPPNSLSNNSGVETWSIVPVLLPVTTRQTPAASQDELVQLYPNPAREQATLRWQAKTSEAVQVDVFDAVGRRLISIQHHGRAGWNELPVLVQQLSAGVYTVALRRDGGPRTVRHLAVEK